MGRQRRHSHGRVAHAVVLVDQRQDLAHAPQIGPLQALGKTTAVTHFVVPRYGRQHCIGKPHAFGQGHGFRHVGLVACALHGDHGRGRLAQVGRQLELANVVDQCGHTQIVQLLALHAQGSPQQQRNHHDVDRMQPVALAHTLGQQPDDRVAVFQQFGHASRDQRLALGPGLVRVLGNRALHGLVLTGGF